MEKEVWHSSFMFKLEFFRLFKYTHLNMIISIITERILVLL